QHVARRHLRQRLARLQRRKGAFEPAQIDGGFGHGGTLSPCRAPHVKVLARLTAPLPLRHIGLMADLRSEIQRIERLMPLADAEACIDRVVTSVRPRGVEPARAFGRCLVGDIVFKRVRPSAAIALRDGVALSADATLDASSYAPVPLPGAPAYVD